jgi:hypothetical protein
MEEFHKLAVVIPHMGNTLAMAFERTENGPKETHQTASNLLCNYIVIIE